MRQLDSFLKAIHIRTTKEEYYRMAFFASLHRVEIKPLEEVLGVESEIEDPFDDETRDALDKRALQLLAERQEAKARGR